MTVLDNGVVVDERFTAVYQTLEKDVPTTFGVKRGTRKTCIHHWGELGQKFDDVVNFLRTANTRKVSAHFVVQDGRATCLVSPADVAWHAGDGRGNAETIGIECRPEMTAGDVATLASLIRFLEKTYGDQEIWVHSNFANTTCPGKYGTKAAIDNLVSKINSSTVSTTKPNTNQVVKCKCA